MIPQNTVPTQVLKFKNTVELLLTKVSNLVLFIDDTHRVVLEDENYNFVNIFEYTNFKNLNNGEYHDTDEGRKYYQEAIDHIYSEHVDYIYIINSMIKLLELIDIYFLGYTLRHSAYISELCVYQSLIHTITKRLEDRISDYVKSSHIEKVMNYKLIPTEMSYISAKPIETKTIMDVTQRVQSLISNIEYVKKTLEGKNGHI